MMKTFFLVLLLANTSQIFAQNSVELRNKHFNTEKKLAIQGYDPVAYFTTHKGIRGKAQISATYLGVVYYFSTQKNKKSFLKNPSKYEPQYGGWCAFAMGDYAEKVEINPKTFKIIDGKLYLFYNAYFNNTLKSWNKDEKNLKRKADINWKKMIRN